MIYMSCVVLNELLKGASPGRSLWVSSVRFGFHAWPARSNKQDFRTCFCSYCIPVNYPSLCLYVQETELLWVSAHLAGLTLKNHLVQQFGDCLGGATQVQNREARAACSMRVKSRGQSS
eukprot:jgi/Botrbrau1/11837/Bobra.0175s0002.1